MINRPLIKLVVVIFLLIAIWSCKEAPPKQAIETPDDVFNKEGELKFFKEGNQTEVVSIDIEIAETDYETETGLMYRSGMGENQGMLFVFDYIGMHSFYMKNTEFALDIIFIDDQFRVASFKDNAQPLDESSISSQVPIQYVLEVNAGLREEWGVVVGDSIAFSRN